MTTITSFFYGQKIIFVLENNCNFNIIFTKCVLSILLPLLFILYISIYYQNVQAVMLTDLEKRGKAYFTYYNKTQYEIAFF